jgi:hypothetical protein
MNWELGARDPIDRTSIADSQASFFCKLFRWNWRSESVRRRCAACGQAKEHQ